MTAIRRDGNDTEFGRWMRKHPRLHSVRDRISVTNVDYVQYLYEDAAGDAHMMLLEEKCYRANLTITQSDTISIIHQAMWQTYCVNRHQPQRGYFDDQPRLHYHGWHVLQFEQTSPDDGIIWIDACQVSSNTLGSFLRFEWMPPKENWHPDARLASGLGRQMIWRPDHLGINTLAAKMAGTERQRQRRLTASQH